METNLRLGFGNAFAFPEVALPQLFKVRKQLDSDASLQLIRELHKLAPAHLSGIFRFSSFHTSKLAFSLYKTFHKEVRAKLK